MRKRIILLGASGCIGNKTIDVIKQHEDLYELIGITVGKNWQFADEYLSNNSVRYCCCQFENDAERLTRKHPNVVFYHGDEGLQQITSIEGVDLVFNAIQGFAGLMPTINAIRHHTDVAVANKESLVAAGDLVVKEAKEYNVNLIPVDSEHSAIFQTINGYQHEDIKKLIITASGGAFKNKSREELKQVTKADALKHPRWQMGEKITIDSATMMNKGFEVIEAHVLFDMPYSKIETILHPESTVHSMTEFNDHAILAQLGVADMRVAIQYALSYPRKIDNSTESLDLCKLGALHFYEMDHERFPLVKLAYQAGEMGGNMPAILNGANETAVDAFLEEKCSFLDIERINFKVVELGKKIYKKDPDLDDIVYANDWATSKAMELIKEVH